MVPRAYGALEETRSWVIDNVPASVPGEHRRAYVLTLAGYLFMVAAQGSLFVIFLAGSEFEIIYPWLAPFIGRPLKLIYAALGTLAFAGFWVLGVVHGPAHPLGWPWSSVIAAVNAVGIAAC